MNTGTYEISGSTLTTRPVFALVPSFIGGHAEQQFSLDGNTLTLTVVNVESADGVQVPAMAAGGRAIYTLERVD
jgi:hypothetical protein